MIRKADGLRTDGRVLRWTHVRTLNVRFRTQMSNRRQKKPKTNKIANSQPTNWTPVQKDTEVCVQAGVNLRRHILTHL